MLSRLTEAFSFSVYSILYDSEEYIKACFSAFPFIHINPVQQFHISCLQSSNFSIHLVILSNLFNMKTFTISAAFAFLAALSHAAPAPTEITARSYSGYEAQVTFYGAADAEFSLSIPADGRLITISRFPSSCFYRPAVSPSHFLPAFSIPDIPPSPTSNMHS